MDTHPTLKSARPKAAVMHETPRKLDTWQSLATEAQEGGPNETFKNGGWFMLGAAIFAGGGWLARPGGYLDDGKGGNMALMCYAAAIFLAGTGILYFRESSRLKALAAQREHQQGFTPDQPWKWDYAWDSEGSSNRIEKDVHYASAGLIAALAAGTYASIYFASNSVTNTTIAWFVTIFLAATTASLYFIRRHHKFGQTRLRFRTFPFHTGERIEGVISGERWLKYADSVRVTLRYIDEIYETVGTGKSRRRESIAWEGFRSELNFDAAALGGPEQTHVTVNFDIPADGPTTALHEIPPHYWDMEVNVVSKGVDYLAHFLVPIYPKRAS